MIDHKKNGYLATPFDVIDLANGIEWILNTKNYNSLCKNARDKVLEKFDAMVITKHYISLYKEKFNA
jgi:glycosyltransferase involved in cell wall biosynthesis